MAYSILHNMYQDLLLSMTCKSLRGKIVPAKPLMMLAIFDVIEKNKAKNNKINIVELKDEYRILLAKHDASTPFQYPFYFMESEPFYHLKWRGDKIETKAPTLKMLLENIEYAFLDNALWDILQESETRDYFRNAIINSYLK